MRKLFAEASARLSTLGTTIIASDPAPVTAAEPPRYASPFACASKCFFKLPQTMSHMLKMLGSAIA